MDRLWLAKGWALAYTSHLAGGVGRKGVTDKKQHENKQHTRKGTALEAATDAH